MDQTGDTGEVDETQGDPMQRSHVYPVERNGSITALGILVGFSLTVFSSWIERPEDWNLIHVMPLALYVAGVGMQLWALHDQLRLPPGTLEQHRRTVGIAAIGIAMMVVGFLATIAIDVAVQ
jgi:hypothetical protein